MMFPRCLGALHLMPNCSSTEHKYTRGGGRQPHETCVREKNGRTSPTCSTRWKPTRVDFLAQQKHFSIQKSTTLDAGGRRKGPRCLGQGNIADPGCGTKNPAVVGRGCRSSRCRQTPPVVGQCCRSGPCSEQRTPFPQRQTRPIDRGIHCRAHSWSEQKMPVMPRRQTPGERIKAFPFRRGGGMRFAVDDAGTWRGDSSVL